MKIYKYMAIAAVATFTLSAAQAKVKDTREGFEASGGFAFSENQGSEHNGNQSEQWRDFSAGGGIQAEGYQDTRTES